MGEREHTAPGVSGGVWPGVAATAGLVVAWSAIPVLVKVALGGFSPSVIAFMRLSLAGGPLVAIHLARGGRVLDLLPQRGWQLLGTVAVTGNNAVFAFALQGTSASAGILVIQLQFVSFVVLSAVVLHERVSVRQMIAIGVVVIGVFLVVVAGTQARQAAPAPLRGNLLMVVASLGWAVFALSQRALSRDRSALATTTPLLVGATLLSGVLSALDPTADWSAATRSWGALLALGLGGTTASFFLLAVALRRLSSATVGTSTAISPIGGVVLANSALGEPLSPILWLSAVMVIGGVTAILRDERGDSGSRSSAAAEK